LWLQQFIEERQTKNQQLKEALHLHQQAKNPEFTGLYQSIHFNLDALQAATQKYKDWSPPPALVFSWFVHAQGQVWPVTCEYQHPVVCRTCLTPNKTIACRANRFWWVANGSMEEALDMIQRSKANQ